MFSDAVHSLAKASARLFLPVRRAVGPLHRRRGNAPEDPNVNGVRPLSEPWSIQPWWYQGGTPPRLHNLVTSLPHGDTYFTDLYEALTGASERVTICAWCLTPMVPLLRGGQEGKSILAQVLHDVSLRANVYVLLWSGAPALFEPDSRHVKAVQRQLLQVAPRVRCELDTRAAFSHDHHQKAVTIDGKVAYVGGMDLCTFEGDRWDTADHPLRFGPNWHDVQVRIEGEAVHDVEQNFCQRWNAVTAEDLRPLDTAAPESQWNTPVQVVRTIPSGFYPFAPNGEYGIRHSLLAAIRAADRFIYLENQYLWSPGIVEALIDAMNRPRSHAFRIVLVLPAKAESGKYDNEQHIRRLRSMDHGRGIFHSYTLYASGPAAGATGYKYLPVYVHGKVSIVDDRWVSVGSANLNDRGLHTDTEMNVQFVDESVARDLRVRLWAEHLGEQPSAIAELDPIDIVDRQWLDAGRRMTECMEAGVGMPASLVYPYVPSENPGSRLLDYLQNVTLEH